MANPWDFRATENSESYIIQILLFVIDGSTGIILL